MMTHVLRIALSVLIVIFVPQFAYGGASLRDCLRRRDRVSLPEPYKLLTIQEFREFVSNLISFPLNSFFLILDCTSIA